MAQSACMNHTGAHTLHIHWSIHIHADLTVAYDIHSRCLCRVLNVGFNALLCVPLSPSAKSGLTSYSGPGTLCGAWTVAFGGCSFSGNGNGAPLLRAGSCPTEVGELHLAYKSITVVPGVFERVRECAWCACDTRTQTRTHFYWFLARSFCRVLFYFIWQI